MNTRAPAPLKAVFTARRAQRFGAVLTAVGFALAALGFVEARTAPPYPAALDAGMNTVFFGVIGVLVGLPFLAAGSIARGIIAWRNRRRRAA